MDTKHIECTNLKTSSEDGTFFGKASTFGNVDRQGDLVEHGAFRRTIREKGGSVVLLAQHDPANVIGRVELQERPDALHVKGKLSLGLQSAKEMLIRMRDGLIDAMSIGFNVVDAETDRRGIRHIKEVDLWEVSLVTFPANPEARVSAVKDHDPIVMAEIEHLIRTIRSVRQELQ